ncbi:MAG: NosD domain-containing protein [Thermoplasmata archaeon]
MNLKSKITPRGLRRNWEHNIGRPTNRVTSLFGTEEWRKKEQNLEEQSCCKILVFFIVIILVINMLIVLICQSRNVGEMKIIQNSECDKSKAVDESLSEIKTEGVPHAQIYINGNEGFSAINGVVGGSGTHTDPYIIEKWNINANGSNYCIWIENTNAYFVIRDCYLHGAAAGDNPYGSGIALINVTNGKIENNKLSGNSYGVYLFSSSNNTIICNDASGSLEGIYLCSSSNNTIANNNVTSNYYGIYLVYSYNNNITYNDIFGNSWNGIGLQASTDNYIMNNRVFYNCWHGIYLDSTSDGNSITNNNVSGNENGIFFTSSNNQIANNKVSNNFGAGIRSVCSTRNNITHNNVFDNWIGIYLDSSSDHIITNNIMQNNSIMIWGCSLSHWNTHNIDTTNLVNGKPVYYYKNQTTGMVPSDAGQVILANCTNMTVNGLNISKSSVAIELGFSSYNTISNNNVSANNYGILLDASTYNTVTNNTASVNAYYGLYLYGASNNDITNNTIYNNLGNGIYLFVSSNSNNITNNSVTDNCQNGISLDYFSNDNTITSNTVSDNAWSGIYLSYSNNNSIINNNASGNDYGVYTEYSSNNTLTNNIMYGNGIMICGLGVSYWNTHNINTTNLVNGKPVYYYKDQTSGAVPSNAGQVILANCTNMTISGLSVDNASVGILLGFSSHTTIINNNVSHNTHGIYLVCSPNNIIMDNNATSNSYGVYVEYSISNLIKTNNAAGNYIGIYLYKSCNNTLTNNTMHHDGIVIWGDELAHWNTHNIDTTNLVNGKPVYYYKNQTTGMVPSDAGQVILANCTNMTITGLNVRDTSVGILLIFSRYTNITDNNVSGNSHGIYLGNAWNITITNNTVTDNNYGLYLEYSWNITISGNNASNNEYGVYLQYSSKNKITDNWFCNNGNYGLSIIMGSKENCVYHNRFIGNNGAGKGVSGNSQAYDSVGGNYWCDNTLQEGNYWSNWDGNGWGSAAAYPIDGGAGASDWYPLSSPVNEGTAFSFLMLVLACLIIVSSNSRKFLKFP